VFTAALEVTRGTDCHLHLAGLGDLSGLVRLYFAAKRDPQDEDSASRLLADDISGLLTLADAPASDAVEVLVTDASAGDVTLNLKAAATSRLAGGPPLVYGLKGIFADGTVVQLALGALSVLPDVPRALA
jgi:hypothetical protein